MEFRSHLLCSACRLDIATDLTHYDCHIGRVTQFIVFIINQSMNYNLEILTKKRQFLC